MSITSEINKVIYNGDGISTVFPYSFKIYVDTELVVQLYDTTTKVFNTLILNVDYTVSGAGLDAGGNVTKTTVLASGKQLIIERVVPITQEIVLKDNERTPAATFEEGYDRAVMICQQLQEQLNRCIKQNAAQTGEVEFPELSVGYLYCDGLALSFTAITGINTYPGTISRGLDAAKPATPAAGDVYIATDTQKLYICYTATVWTALFQSRNSGTFVNADLAAGLLTITHNMSLSAPYSLLLSIFDNTGKQIVPDSVTAATDTVVVDLTSYGALTGTWGYIYY